MSLRQILKRLVSVTSTTASYRLALPPGMTSESVIASILITYRFLGLTWKRQLYSGAGTTESLMLSSLEQRELKLTLTTTQCSCRIPWTNWEGFTIWKQCHVTCSAPLTINT